MGLERRPFEQRLKALQQGFQSWRPQLEDICKYVVPTRGFFDGDVPNRGKAPDYETLVDGTPTWAARTLASGMTSGLTSPSRPWFKLGLADPDLGEFEPVREWLDVVQNRMLNVFAKSNIYDAFYSMYEELAGPGTSAMLIMEDREQIIRARNFTIGEYVLGVGADGRVNTLGRDCYMTAQQMVQEFGFDACSPQVQNAWKNQNVDQWFKLAHLIEPNDDRIPGREDFKNMPTRSVYWEWGAGTDQFLARRGYEEFPVIAPRWATTRTVDSYGKGPAWDALGDIKMLQKMQQDKLIALAKLANPPLEASAAVEGDVNDLPGGVTRSASNARDAQVRPLYQVNPQIRDLQFAIGETQSGIKKFFYADLFLMLAQDDKTMTAREVAVRHEEKLLMLGPVLVRIYNEGLNRVIARSFSIMNRLGQIPIPPKEIQGADINVEYISILAQAQKMVGLNAIDQYFGFISRQAALDPSALDNYDNVQASQAYGDMLGLPSKIRPSAAEIQQMRASRAKAQAQLQASQDMANTVAGAKTMSETKLNGDSALDALVGTNDQGGAP